MYIITATFDPDLASARVTELLALGDSPERLAERLGMPRELDMVKQGVVPASFRRLMSDLGNLQKFIDIEKQIGELENNKTVLRFLGDKFKVKQMAKLKEERRKFGSLIEAPRWFYKQPRIRLLAAIRDCALEASQQGDAAWIETDEKKLLFPIAEMFETANLAFAATLVEQIEKPLKNVSPKFLLESFEGNRTIGFDFEKNIATYYTPAANHGA